MLFRRVSQHVKDQNWFAVWIDFMIVVFGVFIGLQVANWNAKQQDKSRETVLLAQLGDEFGAIIEQIEEEYEIAQERLEATKYVVEIIDMEAEPDTDKIKLALIRNMGLGRVPSTSATYQQLVANGDLPLISNDKLRRHLIKYHDEIDKNGFLFERTLHTVSEFLSANQSITVDVNAPDFSDRNAQTVTHIDWPELRQRRPYFVNTFIFNNLFVGFYARELETAEEVLSLIEQEQKK